MLAFLMMAESPLDHIVPHPILERELDLGGWPLTPEGKITLLSDQIMMMMLAGLLLILLVPMWVRKRRGRDGIDSMVPTGPANAIEAICQYLRNEVARPALHEHTDRFIKYLWSVFFFVLTINLLGLIPLAPLSPYVGAHIGGTATGNVYVTFTLAILTMLMMVINGLRLGGRHYLAHFSPGPWWLSPLLVPVEIIGLIARIFALGIRLFANMIAGHILLAVLLSFILSAAAASVAMGLGIAVPVVLGSVAITLLELFVAFLQAFIFTFLSALFLGQSVVFHHGEDHHHGEAGEAAAH
jgi:F-type H+-transporting ATPase subunit a